MSLLDDENILINGCKNQTRAFHRILEISDVYNKPRRRQELINYLNTYLTFCDYRWTYYQWTYLFSETGLALRGPNKWNGYAIVVRWNSVNNKYLFDFIGNENDVSYVNLKETMIRVLDLYHNNKSDRNYQYYKNKYSYEIH
jgi:hypothetical protein